MSRWKDEFDSHPVLNMARELITLCEELSERGASEEAIRELRRIITICNQIGFTLQKVDAVLAPIEALGDMQRGLFKTMSEVERYQKGLGDNTLFSANDELTTNVLPSLALLQGQARFTGKISPLRSLQRYVDKMMAENQRLSALLDEKLIELSDRHTSAETSLENLSNEVAERKQYLIEIIEEFQQTFARQQNEINNAFHHDQNERKNEFSEDQNRRNNEFSEAQTKRDNIFQQDQTQRSERYTEWLNQHQLDAQSQIKNLTSASEGELQAKMESMLTVMQKNLGDAKQAHKEMLQLFEIAAGDSFSVGYIKTAGNERWMAYLWNAFALGFILFAAVLGWRSINGIEACNSDCNYWLMVVRSLPLSAILLIGAAFSARRGKMHHDNERAARWLALEVQAIEPFIASLSQKDKSAIKAKLAEKLFGQQSAQRTEKINKEIIEDSIFSVIGRECVSWFKKSKGGE